MASATVVVAAIAAVLGPPSPARTAAGPVAVAPVVAGTVAAPATATHAVTLLTGDRIEYTDLPDGRAHVAVDPATRPDGNPVVFRTVNVRGPGGQPGLYVIPSDTERYLAAGTVDRELFNVRELSREGLDDARSGTLPVIVTYDGPAVAGKAPAATGALPGAAHTRTLNSVRGAALKVDRRAGARFWSAIGPAGNGRLGPTGPAALGGGLSKVWLDHRVRMTLDRSVPQIGAPAAWQAGYDGTGVTVGVLDTGVDADHPDLAGRLAGAADFTEGGTTADGNGHGTHVATTIAGTGAASGGRFRGAAPGAKLMVGKVLDDEGFGLDSWVISGMEWAARGGAKVVSMSLGGPPTDGTDPLSLAVNGLTAETGTLFVVAAGNSGVPASIGTPAAADAALTVGAVDRTDGLAPFSSRGPRWGDGAAKPEIAAPGVNIVAGRGAGTGLGNPVDQWYTALSGTSMATPHVAGAAAIYAQRHPDWRAAQMKDGLVTSATEVAGGGWAGTGAGRLDVGRAVRQGVTGPAAINLGRMARGAGPARRTIEYTNSGSLPVTLNLRLSPSNWRGRPAPAGVARLSTAAVTVPAGGRAAVDLVVDPAAVAGGGVFGGAVVAEAAGVQLRSLFSLYVAAETAALTVRVVDHRGQPTSSGTVSLVDGAYDPGTDDDPFATATYDVFVNGGTGTTRVRKGGLYTAVTSQGWYRLDVRRADVMVSPETRVTGDTTITLDARQGQQHVVSTMDKTDPLTRATEVVRSTGGAVLSVLVAVRNDRDLGLYVTPVPAPVRGHLDLYDKRTLASAGLTATATVSPPGSAPVTIPLDPRYDPFGTPGKLAGDRTVPLVWAGEGRPADLAGVDVRGRLALVGVRVPDTAPNPLNHAVQAVNAATATTAAAGALGIVAYVDVVGAGALPAAGANPIPQLFVTRAEGALLRDRVGRGPVQVSLRGNPTPPVMYNLYYPHAGLPAGHEHRVHPADLVAIPTRYHADEPMAYEKNYFVFGARSHTALRESVRFRGPVARMEFVGPGDPTVLWRRWITQNEQPPNRPVKISTLIGNDVYAAGERSRPEERWFEGPIREGEPTGLGIPTCGMCRGGPDGSLLVPPWRLGDSTDTHFIQSWPDYRSEVRLFRGAVEVAPQPLTVGLPVPTFRLAPEPDTYRLLTDGPTPRNPALRAVHHTTTEWTFRSARPAAPAGTCPAELPGGCVHQPLIQLRYRLGLGLTNRSPVGQFTFEVTAAAPAGAAGAGTPAGLSLWFSIDAGVSWRPAMATVSLGAGRYRVVLTHPASPGSAVWLKAEAWDSAGNRVRQTVRDAYRLAAPAPVG